MIFFAKILIFYRLENGVCQKTVFNKMHKTEMLSLFEKLS